MKKLICLSLATLLLSAAAGCNETIREAKGPAGEPEVSRPT